ncbi:MAG TPA: hypothetical protein VFR61_00970, partial [Nitrososphaeraceae archaeon]|nr:hypothetical protein [Nitrososphaeraceae archaeon]
AIIVSFIASFGAVKAVLNLLAGNLSDKWGRKNVLVLGWRNCWYSIYNRHCGYFIYKAHI